MTQMYHAITKHTHTHTLFFFFLKKKERERMWRGYMGWGVIKRWYERLARTRRHTYTETTIMQYSPTSFLCLILSHPLSSRSTTNKQTKKGGCVWCDCVCVCVCAIGKKKKKSKKECGPTISDGLSTDAHSQVRSHYCATRRLLPAVFPPWAGSSLLRQPGPPGLPPRAHIDAGLSVDTRSTWHAC